MNEMSLTIFQWLPDYYVLATVLLACVLVIGKLVCQPARRIAVSWSVAIGLLGLGLLCAVPGWSWVHMTSSPPAPYAGTTQFQPPINTLEQNSQLLPPELPPETGSTDRPTLTDT
jgi:hypothetical protein